MSLSEYLKKIRNLTLVKRKIIFWVIIIIFGVILFALYLLNIKQKIKTFPLERSLEELRLPQLKEELKNLPKFEIEKPKEEIKGDIKEIEKLMEEIKKQQGQK